MAEGLRERKKAETRRALSSAALRLADRHGPEGVTVEAIAEAAGVSPRTFFNYFASKDDAIVGLGPAHSSNLLHGLLTRPADEPPLDALLAAVHSVLDGLEASAGDWRVRHGLLQRYPALAARYASRFAEVERGLAEEIARRTRLDPDLDTYPGLVVSAALGATRVAITAWQAREDRGDLGDVIEEAFDQLAAGLDLDRVPTLASAPTGP
ncbi:MAG TPA: TetR family transcriptional regulator [Acidimicrobiales bacterium]|nr:TetR family transcriptional regulator [Acidimicrobiales bacterium]